ncbi:MAG: hypothetical protein LH624_05105 [Cryobacterium sp.]|nr:hypothetical protein [Cryobacterium sp.]
MGPWHDCHSCVARRGDGELAKAVRKGSREEQFRELGDTLAWLAPLANQLDIALEESIARYRPGCPRCGAAPCRCAG